MANTLTAILPTIYAGLDVVSRELIGFIPNVQRDATAQSGAVGQTVRSPVVPAISTENITAGATPANSGDQTFGSVDVSISKSKAAPIRWNGEEQLAVTKDGIVNTVLRDQFAQAFRAIANEVEADLAATYVAASRAYGSAGTAPFGTINDLTDMSQANLILDENGAPASDRVMILGGAARANLEGKHAELFKLNESGDGGALLRQRQMRQLMGFTIGYSSGVVSHVKGAGTGYDINQGAGEAIGQTTLTLDGGTVNTTGVKAGDIVTFAGDSNKYVVTTGTTSASGDIVIGAPGLRIAAADATEMTIGNSYAANMFFSRNALLLAARVPAMPIGGDDADDVSLLTDPVSGLTFQVAVYKQYRQVKYEVGLAWGVKMVKPEHCGILLG
jgi:hypothetical protein